MEQMSSFRRCLLLPCTVTPEARIGHKDTERLLGVVSIESLLLLLLLAIESVRISRGFGLMEQNEFFAVSVSFAPRPEAGLADHHKRRTARWLLGWNAAAVDIHGEGVVWSGVVSRLLQL